MNIETLKECINTFKYDVINTGFKRDLDDYISSLPAAQNNIVVMRDIANKVSIILDELFTGDLPEALNMLLPKDRTKPFTAVPHDTKLRTLIEDTEIQQSEFYNQLTQIINQLLTQIQQNIIEIDNIEQFISPYIIEEKKHAATEHTAIISIVFKEQNTITSLNQFTKTLNAWNKILPVYHQLLKSQSPKDIQIVEVQNGSIDFVINMNVDVALDLVELFKVGFEVFAAYLSYKKMIKPIIDSYHGNKILISQEEQREKLLLENIGEAINKQIESQHKLAKKADKNIDGTAIQKKIEQVTNLITSHIVKGNDLKLLSIPESQDTDEIDMHEEQIALRNQSIKARQQLRQINIQEKQKLIEVYGKLKDDSE